MCVHRSSGHHPRSAVCVGIRRPHLVRRHSGAGGNNVLVLSRHVVDLVAQALAANTMVPHAMVVQVPNLVLLVVVVYLNQPLVMRARHVLARLRGLALEGVAWLL